MNRDADMTLNESEQNQLIINIARNLVVKVVPQEVPLFRATSQAFFENPQKVLEKQKSEDVALGFGLEAGSIFLTPAVLAIVTQVITFIAGEIKDAVKKEVGSSIAHYIKKLIHPDPERTQTPAPLSIEQLRRVRQLAMDKARQLNVPEEKVQLLVSALLGELAIPALP